MFWTIVLSSAILYVVWKLFLADEENPLDRLPGPPRKPFIGSTLEFVRVEPRELFDMMRRFAKEYGDRYVVKIFRRRILHVHNVHDVEMVLSHSKNITKSKPYSFLEPWLGTGLLLSTGSKWHRRRKILTPTFHFNILKGFALVIEEKSRNLVEKLKTMRDLDVDLIPIISDFTLYTICETAMGTQLDSDKSAATVDYKKTVLEIDSLIFDRLTRVWFHNNFLFKMSALGKKFYSCLEIVHSFCDKVIAERKQQKENEGRDVLDTEEFGSKRRMAMLDLLLEAEAKGEIDLEGIREEVNTFMFEGHDTTAIALTFGLMLLADHTDVQERIYEEIQQVLCGSDRPLTSSDLAEMKYLEAVIKETLRLYPSVPFIARTITEDFVLGDLPVRKGSEVAVHIYDLHRRPELFPEPESFRPERFLEGELKHPYAFVPFSAGPRNCIGQKFAMLEMKCVLGEICRNFRLEPKSRGARPALLAHMLIRTVEPVYVKFIQR